MNSKLSLLFILNLLNDVHSQILNGSLFTNYEFYGWDNDMIYCDNYIDCIVNCYATAACYYLHVYGPKNAKLTINCNAGFNGNNTNPGYPCGIMNVYAEDSTELYINVYNEDFAFANVNIYTPTSRTVNTFIVCGITDEFSEFTDRAPSRPEVCGKGNTIYSKYGFSTVEWTYFEDNTWAIHQYDNRIVSVSKMYCGDVYQYSCSGLVPDTDSVNCRNESSRCAADGIWNPPSTTDVIISMEDMESTYDEPSSTDVISNTEADDANEYRNFMVVVIISIIMIVLG